MSSRWLLCFLGLASSASSPAANFVCQADVSHPSYTVAEQQRVDRYWSEVVVYLREYLHTLQTPSGNCARSAEATVQTYESRAAGKEFRCILDAPDMALLAKQVAAVVAEPDKAKACFDVQSHFPQPRLFTPSAAVRAYSPVSAWIHRPLLTDYYRGIGGAVGKAGIDFANAFLEATSQPAPTAHWRTDVSMRGLPTLWSSVGWIPMYAENPSAGSSRFRGGYAYAEVMGPWGALRIQTIDGESVGAEIGMTVQMAGTFYPFHFHQPQESYITLSEPHCDAQYQGMILAFDSDQLHRSKTAEGWQILVDGSGNHWKDWFKSQDGERSWLTYSDRNSVHSFYARRCSAPGPKNALVAVWARSTARDHEQSTRLCRAADPSGKRELDRPWIPAICDLRDVNQ